MSNSAGNPGGQQGTEVADFFEVQQSSQTYSDIKKLTRLQDELAASWLNKEVSGDALFVGGVWEFFKKEPQLKSLWVLDLSEVMAKTYAPKGASVKIGDLYETEFKENTFDSIVYPLIIHHTALGSMKNSKRRASNAIARAKKWLKPGGTLFILEYCPAKAWAPIQTALFPLTRFFLKTVKQSMVVMFTREFYEKAILREFGRSPDVRKVQPRGYQNWKWFPVFLGVKWLRLPLIVYPKMFVFKVKIPRTTKK